MVNIFCFLDFGLLGTCTGWYLFKSEPNSEQPGLLTKKAAPQQYSTVLYLLPERRYGSVLVYFLKS
jgi:hypothetical protein